MKTWFKPGVQGLSSAVVLAGILIALGVSVPAGATTFFTDFNSGVLDPQLVSQASSSGFHLTLSGGVANVAKDEGTGNGEAQIHTAFQVLGDFTASVEATRSNLSNFGELGLIAYFDNNFADVFFFDAGTIDANVYPDFSATTANSAPSVTFRIRRTGSTFYEEYDAGGGFVTLLAAEGAGTPVVVGLFLAQESNNTAAHAGLFDNLTINADAFSTTVPEPSGLVLAGTGLAAAAALRRWLASARSSRRQKLLEPAAGSRARAPSHGSTPQE